KSERIVQEALDAASEGRTTIIVAHRLSTIKNVDRVIVMHEGRVVESGGYDSLRLRPSGIFAEMVAAQEVESSGKEEEPEILLKHRKSSERDDEISLDSIQESDADQFPITMGGAFQLYLFNKRRAILTTLLSLLQGIELPLIGLSYFFAFSSLKDTEYEDELFWTMIGTLLVGVYSFLIIIVSQAVLAYTSESTMREFRLACFSSLIRRPIAYFDRRETSPAASSVLLSQQPSIAMPVPLCIYCCRKSRQNSILPRPDLDLFSPDSPQGDGHDDRESLRWVYYQFRHFLHLHSLRIRRSLSLVGPSGGGKSTVINLVERFYRSLDGILLPSISSSTLHSAIALVSQEPILFRGS
ncbi:hypothetical protein PMAYCL1PPCAC_07763, partial [Pristionchus mayeri]